MTHPDRRFFPAAESLEQATAALAFQIGPSVFPPLGPGHLAAREVRQQLHTVAEAEDRSAQLEELGIGGGDAFSIHRIGAARENDALRIPRPNPVDTPGWRMDLAVDMRLAYP